MQTPEVPGFRGEVGRTSSARADAAAEWRSPLAAAVSAVLLFLAVTGGTIYLLPFSGFNQLAVLSHTLLGLVWLPPLVWYALRHWRIRRGGNLSHFQALGYLSLAVLLACAASGVVLTVQALWGTRTGYTWDVLHLVSGAVTVLFVAAHLYVVLRRAPGNRGPDCVLREARRAFGLRSAAGCAAGVAACLAVAAFLPRHDFSTAFPEDYNWRFGEDRPFAPSLARVAHRGSGDDLMREVLALVGERRAAAFQAAYDAHDGPPTAVFARMRAGAAAAGLDVAEGERLEALLERTARAVRQSGAINPDALAGSHRCGTAGCHEQIYREWLPSAHRYAALDDLFQRVQEIMAAETSPEQTRYCAGCHDPISLFGGAKNPGHITLSAQGYDEGVSCLVCHSIVQSDVQGNADYTIRPPEPYLFERSDGPLAKLVGDFLIRSYPRHHTVSYSRALYRTPEFCGACHKQYIDKEVNTDIGKVQGQNQYDSWRKSRWVRENEPDKTITCRECHMPLQAGTDPAAGDALDSHRHPGDGHHRGHRYLGANQYIPAAHGLEHAEEHLALTEQWLRGEIDIPEIAHKWTSGPVVRMEVVAPERALAGQPLPVQVVLINNKTGHDFPTGPLDMIESWVQLTATRADGTVIYDAGRLSDTGEASEPPIVFRSEGFDRAGELIDRHNLWDLVGARYKRALFPGMTDTFAVTLACPGLLDGPKAERAAWDDATFDVPVPDSLEGDTLVVQATLWYRKANPIFLDRVYGIESSVRAPVTAISSASATVRIGSDA